MTALMSAYGRLPLTISHGKGAWVWDTNGKGYIDALGGLAVVAVGHANEAVASAISDQASKLTHISNLYHIPAQDELGRRLCDVSGMDKAFFCNSGAEANEAMIKVARLHGHHRGITNPSIIVMENSFHGRTIATLTATGNRKIQAGFEPLVGGFVRAPYSDIEALHHIAENNRDIVGVMLEPIQGEGGVVNAAQGYLKAVRDICDQNNWLMMTDEIQTGMGRTGHWFAYQHDQILPDVISVAKALGNGFPVGACLARGAAAELIQPGTHGTTFGGNPMACRAGLAVIEEIEQHDLVHRAGELGERIVDGFKRTLTDRSEVVAFRGRGCMIGIELNVDCAEIVKRALDAGVLLNVTAARVVRMLPPYILTDDEADELVARVSGVICEFLDEKVEAGVT